jgi:serine/threonine-protein kinase
LFDAWWMRAAARDPAQRFQSAKELADTLSVVFGLAPMTSGPVALGSPSGGPTPASMPVAQALSSPGQSSPGLVSSPAMTPAHGALLSPTMAAAATVLPSPAAMTPGRAGAPPDRTMSPASRTFAGDAPPRKSPAALLAVIGVLGLAAVAIVLVFALRGKPTDSASALASSPAAAAPPAPTAPKPSVAPADPVPIASETAPAAPIPPPPKPVVHPKPAAPPPVAPPPPPTPPPPARTGKVRIVAPG